MRKLARFALNILGSLGGGPLSIGFELPGVPQVAPEPKWITMSSKDFPEAIALESARKAATNEAGWKFLFDQLYKCLDSSPQGIYLAVILNNLAVAAYRAGNQKIAELSIERADQVPVSIPEVKSVIRHNLKIMG